MNAIVSASRFVERGPCLQIFETVPVGHLVYAVTDDSCMPLVEPGEVLVVEDAHRTFPMEDQWFLIEWIRKPACSWERERSQQTIGIPKRLKKPHEELWGYYPPCRKSRRGVTFGGDGWFGFDRMTDLIRGRVVGIYRPGGVQ